jgi:DNA-binding response OmpR family regulator
MPELKSILVIEDSATQSIQLKKLLEGEGLQVFTALDGEKGLALVNEKHPDLIILDLQLPHMNGFQVAQEIKSNPETQKIPIIMLTIHGEEESKRLGFQLGATEFIPKDRFATKVLLETLRQMGFELKTPG